MSKTRRVFGKEFKAKVALEALKEKETLEALAKKYQLLPTQISQWKAEAIKNIGSVFDPKKAMPNKQEIPAEKLYARIGELTLENDFLKKKLL